MENRLVELETRVAFQDDAIAQLNAVVSAQEQRIRNLELQLEQVLELIRALTPSPVARADEETPPPHY